VAKSAPGCATSYTLLSLQSSQVRVQFSNALSRSSFLNVKNQVSHNYTKDR